MFPHAFFEAILALSFLDFFCCILKIMCLFYNTTQQQIVLNLHLDELEPLSGISTMVGEAIRACGSFMNELVILVTWTMRCAY